MIRSIIVIISMAISLLGNASNLEEAHAIAISKLERKHSFNNARLLEINPNFYMLVKNADRAQIPQIKKSLKLSNNDYGFSLDESTIKACKNRIKTELAEFKNKNRTVFIYSAKCTDWGGDGVYGKSHYALIESIEGRYVPIWSRINTGVDHIYLSLDWYLGYVSDLDEDGNIEVLVKKTEGVSGEDIVYEVIDNNLEIITTYDQSIEGQ